MYRDFGPCGSWPAFVSLFRYLRLFCQGITNHRLKTAEKQAFFAVLRRLAGLHGRLPDSMMITENIEIEGENLVSGGFADVRTGRYMGHLVAVKTMRVAELDDVLKIRKVSVSSFFSVTFGWGPNDPPAILQRSRSLEYGVPPKRLETCRRSGRHGERTFHYCVRVDGAWKHHGVHWKEFRQQTGTGTWFRTPRHFLR